MSSELRDLYVGARFRFAAFPEQTAILVEKGQGRALIRYDRARDFEARTFEARDRTGERVTRQITVDRTRDVEPCALGANVELFT